MIHLPFRFLSAKSSQSKSVSSEIILSTATKKTKRVNLILGLVSIGWAGLLIGCNTSSTVDVLGDWTSKSELEGPARYGAASFVVGTIAYMGTGIDVSNNRLKDFWAYDPSRNAWTQKADFAGVARNVGVGFAVGTNGYIGTGLDANSTRLKDFWQYNPTTNTWKQVADFGGTARQTATAFAIGTKGYVTCGFDGNYLKDMWSYDPTANTWTKVASYGGSKRVGAVAFVINNMAYVGTGNNNNSNQLDWYVYDPSQDLWTQKLNFITDQTSIARSYAVGFAINGKGYLVTGDGNTKDVWQYNPDVDTWETKGVFEGASRTFGVGWAIGNKGYVTTGSNGSSRFDDLWDFDPTVVQVIP
ncbi:galactose oxidase [Spirosoma sp. HMF3257]|uniref:Galactose oxidase n=1 Tax=Spirosoma telluris TaxID=2183553 RepID=A0A327NFK9_9BACT|nr:galactose oxidase [Spirosoma telluris]RAI74022.1 galactose oxidase [Spirosoma telluris]